LKDRQTQIEMTLIRDLGQWIALEAASTAGTLDALHVRPEPRGEALAAFRQMKTAQR
jgi:hypothetical protein